MWRMSSCPGARRGGAAGGPAIVADAPADWFGWLLHTTDARGLYARLRFVPLGERLMQRLSLP